MQQTTASHQMMGYDRASTVFSPDGRLLQVEYAKKPVKQGPSALGLVCKDGAVVIADRRYLDKLMVLRSQEKVFQIDEHIVAAASGILSDARVLIERAQLQSQQHRVTYDNPIDVHSVVKEICTYKQLFTQMGGVRPFGVSLLIAGIDKNGPSLFVTDPAGIHFEYKATAIGESEDEIKEILSRQYKENITVEEGITLGVKALKKVLGKEFNAERIDGAILRLSTRTVEKLNKNVIKRIA